MNELQQDQAFEPRTTIMNEQIRAEFEQEFLPPHGCVYNAEMDHYGWISHPKNEHPFNAQYETWQAAHARYAGSDKQTRGQLPDGITRVRNAATGQITELAGSGEAEGWQLREVYFGADGIPEAYRAPAQPNVPDKKPLPELLMASYHEAIGWNKCVDAMLSRPEKQK
jgi:hypothetical protein